MASVDSSLIVAYSKVSSVVSMIDVASWFIARTQGSYNIVINVTVFPIAYRKAVKYPPVAYATA